MLYIPNRISIRSNSESEFLKTYKVKEEKMKFHKFRDLYKQYPWLINIVDPLGHMRHDSKTMSVQDGISEKLRMFVRKQLEYIAFRPLQQLPDILLQTQGSHETRQTLEYAVRCDPYFGGNYESSYETEWEIIWRTGDHVHQPSPHRDGFTLNESMIEIQMEHAKGYFGEGELHFDFLVKRIIESPRKNSLVKMSIEVYRLPVGVFSRDEVCPEAPMSEHQRMTRRAYFEGGSMPPIIPGSFC